MVLFAGMCDPYLSTLEAFAWTRYTNRRLIYLLNYSRSHSSGKLLLVASICRHLTLQGRGTFFVPMY